VWARTNQTFTVQAEPIPVTGGDPTVTYGTESPYDAGGWNDDQAGWLNAMANPSAGGGSQSFLWAQDNSWPGDFMQPVPPGTLEPIMPDNPPGPVIYADADYLNWGVNTANLVLYMGHGNPWQFSFTYPNAPFDGSSAYWLGLNDAGQNMSVTFSVNPDNTNSAGIVYDFPYLYTLNFSQSWGNIGPNDVLNWLGFHSCNVLQYDANNIDDISPPTVPPNPNALYAWQRWGGAFNGLHMMLGYHTHVWYPLGTPAAFANTMLTGYVFGGTQQAPQTIANAWVIAAYNTQPGGTVAAVMGPIGPGGVWDIFDYYPGKGPMGPSIPPSQITGWWYINYETGLVFGN
jgi:hypothetical protein